MAWAAANNSDQPIKFFDPLQYMNTGIEWGLCFAPVAFFPPDCMYLRQAENIPMTCNVMFENP